MKLQARLLDLSASAFAVAASPFLKLIASKRVFLPMFERVSDKHGFQLRSTHYYEPTYRLSDLPAEVTKDRNLPGLDLNAAGQLELLGRCRFSAELDEIPEEKPSQTEYGFVNGSYEHGDGDMLYNMIRLNRPSRIVEIGSGQSTLMASKAIRAEQAVDAGYACEQICIEPFEQDWLESTGVHVVRRRVEEMPFDLFDELVAGDILFIDSSHIIRPFGDVLLEIQQIIPRVAPGVLIHVHDIFTPRDYPEAWLRSRKLWNEQYLLETFLAFNRDFEVLCAMNWLHAHHGKELAIACPSLRRKPAAQPGAFWMRRRVA